MREVWADESILVRDAESSDLSVIAQLAAETFALACPPTTPAADIEQHIRNELSAERFLEHMESAGVTFQLAMRGPEVVGYTMLVAPRGAGADSESSDPIPAVELPGNRPLELRRIYVSQRWHGRGVSGALMAAAVAVAQRLDCDCMWLCTNKANERAIAFYTRSGFVRVGDREFRVGSSVENDYVLARPLRSDLREFE